MSIQPTGFLDTSAFTAMFIVKYKDRLEGNVLPLRSVRDGDADPSDLPILKEWKTARALLSRIRTGAAPSFGGITPTLGRAWVEVLPPHTGTPWEREVGEDADAYVRIRTCLVPCPLAYSYSGTAAGVLSVGVANIVEHRALCSEANFGDHARIHLVVDVMRPDAPEED